jgi:multidrug efflux pump subunit AcrA (membrane-fusion protein)
VLARIDPHDYQTALDQARANVAAAQAGIETLNQQIGQQKLTVDQARQLVDSDQAAQVFSQQDFQRYSDLAKTGNGTVQRAQQAQADIHQKVASLHRDTTGIGAAEKQIGILQAQLAQADAALAQQQAMAHQAELNLSYTEIAAPLTASGRTAVANMSGRHAAMADLFRLRRSTFAATPDSATDVRAIGQFYDQVNFPSARCTWPRRPSAGEAKPGFVARHATGNFTDRPAHPGRDRCRRRMVVNTAPAWRRGNDDTRPSTPRPVQSFGERRGDRGGEQAVTIKS